MREEIHHFLKTLDGDLAVVREACEPFLGDDANVDPPSGAALISHRPKIAPQAYACVLFPGIPEDEISRYEQIHSKAAQHPLTIPSFYCDTLRQLNGASLFQIDLFGVPGSMTNDPPLLSRSVRQPLDLATANRNWFISYKPQRSQFYFGSGPFSWEENLGYFLNKDGSVDALRKNGEKFACWPTIGRFLAEELARAASIYLSYEERWFEFNQQLEANERERKRAKRGRRK